VCESQETHTLIRSSILYVPYLMTGHETFNSTVFSIEFSLRTMEKYVENC